jgi:hypothetical protein
MCEGVSWGQEVFVGESAALKASSAWAWNFGGHKFAAKIGGRRRAFLPDSASLIGCTSTVAGSGKTYTLRITVIVQMIWRTQM